MLHPTGLGHEEARQANKLQGSHPPPNPHAALCCQVGSEGQDLLIVLEGTVAMFTNFLGGPYAAHASAAASHSQAPDRSGLLPRCSASRVGLVCICAVCW